MIKLDLRDSVFLSVVLAKLKHKILIEWKDEVTTTKLDIAIYNFSTGGKLENLEHVINEQLNFIDDEQWQIILKNIHELFDEYANLPVEFLDVNVRFDLINLYNQEFYRLYNRVNVEEFSNIIGVNQAKSTPDPIQKIGDQSLWTVGQAEELKLKLKIASTVNGDMEVVLADQLKKQHIMRSTKENYSNNALEDLYWYNADWTIKQRFKVVEYLIKSLDLIPNFICPELELFIGEFHCFNGDKNVAKVYIEKTKDDLETMYPNELFGNPIYISSLINLAYLYIEQDNIYLVKNLLEKANEYSDVYEGHLGINALHNFNKGPETFYKWFNKNKRKLTFWSVIN